MICYLRLAAVTGARRGQMVALRWRDIDLDTATVTFTTALARVKGGTAEKGTKADVDYGLALDLKTVDILRAHRKRAVERALVAGGGLSERRLRVHPSRDTGRLEAMAPGRRQPAVQQHP
jgi:integrase